MIRLRGYLISQSHYYLFLILLAGPIAITPVEILGQGIDIIGVFGASRTSFEYEEVREGWDPEGVSFFRAGALIGKDLSGIEGPLGKNLSVQTGLIFKRLSGRVEWQSEVGEPVQQYAGSFSINQFYTAIPIALKLRLFGSPVALRTGLETAVLLWATKRSRTALPVEFSTDMSTRVSDEIRRIHTSLLIGAEATLGPRISLVAQYLPGLAHQKMEPDSPVLITDWRTRELDISILIYLR